MKKALYIFFALLLLIVDQISKVCVRSSMVEGESIPVINNIFHLTHIENRGIAFGMFSGHSMIFALLSIAVLVILVCMVIKENSPSVYLNLGTAMVISGALGNIIDRMMKSSVTDMFDFRIWPIFNVADIAVCVGFALLVIYIIFDSGEDDGEKNNTNTI